MLKEHSTSCSSGKVVVDELAEVLVVSWFKVLEEGWLEPISNDVSEDEVSVPLEPIFERCLY